MKSLPMRLPPAVSTRLLLPAALLLLASRPALAAPPAEGAGGVTDWLVAHFDLLKTSFIVLFILLILLLVWECVFQWQRRQERAHAAAGSVTLARTEGADDPFKALIREHEEKPAAPPSPARPGPGLAPPSPARDAGPATLPPEIAKRVSPASAPPADWDRTARERERAEAPAAEPAPSPAAATSPPGPRRVRLGADEPSPVDVGLAPYMANPAEAGVSSRPSAGRPAFPGAPPTVGKAPSRPTPSPEAEPEATPPGPAVPRAPVKLGTRSAGASDTWTDLLKKATEQKEAAAAPPRPTSPTDAADDRWKSLLRQTREDDGTPAVIDRPAAPKAAPSAEAVGPSEAAAASTPSPAPRGAVLPGTDPVPLPSGCSVAQWEASCAVMRQALLQPCRLGSGDGSAEEATEIAPLSREPAPAEKKRGRKMKLAGGSPEATPAESAPAVRSQGAAPPVTTPSPAPAPARIPLQISTSPAPPASPPTAPPPAVQVPPSPAAKRPPSPAAKAPPSPAARAPRKPPSEPRDESVPEFVKSASKILAIPDKKPDASPAEPTGASAGKRAEAPEKEIPSILRNAEGDRRFLEISRSLKQVRVDKENPPGELPSRVDDPD